jgi:hypothetical protein
MKSNGNHHGNGGSNEMKSVSEWRMAGVMAAKYHQ